MATQQIIPSATNVALINQASLKLSMEDATVHLDKDSFIFEHILRQIGPVRTVTRYLHQWRERRLMATTTLVTADAAAAATSVSVQVPNLGYRDQLVFAPRTGQAFIVDEDVGGTTAAGAIKVRGKAGSGGLPAALLAGDVLILGIEAHAEGEDIPPAFSTTEDDYFTYLQQFDRTLQITDVTDQESQAGYGEPELAKLRRQKWSEFMRQLALTYYWGQKFRETASTSNSARRHGMSGLVEYLLPNAADLSAGQSFTMQTLVEIVRKTRLNSSASAGKWGLCGQNAMTAISAMPATQVRTVPGEQSVWGTTVHKLHGPFGDLDLVYDLLLSQEFGMADLMFVLDKNPDYLHSVQMGGLNGPLAVKTNIQNSENVHNIKDLITGTRGLVLKLPELHRMVKGIN